MEAAGIAPGCQFPQIVSQKDTCVQQGCEWLHYACTDASLRELVAAWHDLTPEVREKIKELGKVNAQARLSYRAKRGAGKVHNASELPGNGDTDEIEALAQVVGSEPTPDSAAAMAEEYRRLLDALGDDTLWSIAVWKMEGHSSDEIADRLGCALRTLARQLALIRTIWRDASSAED